MYRVKLIKALSYSGLVTATAAKPYVDIEDDETAEKVLATGYFQLIEEIETGKSSAKIRRKKDDANGCTTMGNAS